MKIVNMIIHAGLGLMLLVFGLNKFFWFMPDFDFTGYPEAEHLFNALRFSGDEPTGKGYVMNLVGWSEVVIGVLLLIRKWEAFATVMLVPLAINLVLFHAFVNLPNIGPAALVLILNGYLLYLYRDKYRLVFS